MVKEKVIQTLNNGSIRTGYYDEENNFIWHSFDDEPSCRCPDGVKMWYKDDLIHREGNKPAVIFNNGIVEYFLEGKRYFPTNNLNFC